MDIPTIGHPVAAGFAVLERVVVHDRTSIIKARKQATGG